jgi:cytochrome c oxidase cbb3-type subunit 2
LDSQSVVAHLKALKRLGDPYTDEQIAAAAKEVEGKTEQDALVAYLQGLGIHIKARR